MKFKTTFLGLVMMGALLSMPAVAHKYNSVEGQNCTDKDGAPTECDDHYVGTGRVIKCTSDNPGNPQKGTWRSVYPQKQSDGSHAVNKWGEAQQSHTHACTARCFIGGEKVKYTLQYWHTFKCPADPDEQSRS